MNDRLKTTQRKVVNESGIEIQQLYTAQDVQASGGDAMLGQPGAYPFTRGIHAEMYRKQPWTMRQYTGFGNAADTNQRFKYLIANGQTGLNVAFDLPTQCGLDSDDPQADGEVGRVGMAIDTLRDFEIAFDGIDLDKVTVSLTINGAAVVLIAMYLAMAERRGFDLKSLRGTAQNDILKEFIGRGTWIYPVQPSIKLVGDTIEYCAQHAPKYSPVSVCGYHIRESGANPVQEMAYAFCIAKAYADEVIARGLSVDEFAGRLSFNFNIFGSLFEQVAKFRAGRGLWAKIMHEQYEAKKPGSMWMRMIAGGGGGGLDVRIDLMFDRFAGLPDGVFHGVGRGAGAFGRVVVLAPAVAKADRRLHQRPVGGSPILDRRAIDGNGSVLAVIRPVAEVHVVFELAEVGEDFVPAPAVRTLGFPVGKILGNAADGDLPVDGRTAADGPAAPQELRLLPLGAPRQQPGPSIVIVADGAQRIGDAQMGRRLGGAEVEPGFQQQHTAGRVGAQPVGQHAAGRSAAND